MNELPGLGRLPPPDRSKDRDYLLPKRAHLASVVTVRNHWTPKAWDQGGTSQCVAYAANRLLASNPIRNEPVPFDELYLDCQKNDEWPGESYDGTSVRASMKILHRRGFISEYRWAFDLETVVNNCLIHPICMGTDWTYDMFMPDRHGYIWPTDSNAGGHAWIIIGVNRNRRNPDNTVGAVRAMNSWSENWGPHKGRFWLSFGSLAELIERDGEAAVAIEVKNATR